MAFDLLGMFRGKREAARPAKLQGAAGFAVTAGYVQSNETNPNLQGRNRWRTAADLLANVSIIAASVRYTLNMIARPNWRFEPADDSAEAKALAEFAEEVINDIHGSWTATVRRMALYRFHGFGLHEWQAKQRDDGRIGIEKIAVRPCHTVDRWDIDPNGEILGVMQTRPVDGKEIYLPRAKTIYLVDDSLTDAPEGMGWFRHLVEPSNRLKNLLKIETMGFERDLNGIPVGRAPISEINALVGTALQNGTTYTQEMANAAIQGIENFVRMEAKKPGTGLLLDSQPHSNQTGEGEELTNTLMWDIDLLTSDPKSMDAMAKAITRLEYEMALIMGTESMLVGREGEGSRALSEDKSRNLYLLVESTLADMCEFVDRDLMGPVWAMNGLPDELKPKAQTEGASFKDAEKVARVLKDLATAGAVLAPDDPAINDLRDAMDIPRAPDLTDEERGILMGTKPDPNAPMPGEEDEEEPDGDKPPPKKQGQGQANKFDPSQPRDPGGEDGGQWVKGGGVAEERYDGSIVPTSAGTKQVALQAAKIDRHFKAEEALSGAEISAIKDYASSEYRDINGALRKGEVSDDAALIDTAIAKETIVEDITLYRGLGALTTEAEDLPVGTVITDNGFSSTSAEPNIGAKFASWANDYGDQPVLMRIRAQKGAKALHLHPNRAVLGSEHEVLLPRGQKMRITGAPKREKFRVYGEDREVTVVDLELA
jgi:hypothetical protein